MVTTPAQLEENLLYALEQIRCACGNYKRIGKTFCFQCFDSLPREWRQHLASAQVYENEKATCGHCAHMYDAALTYLRQFCSERFRDRDSELLSSPSDP